MRAAVTSASALRWAALIAVTSLAGGESSRSAGAVAPPTVVAGVCPAAASPPVHVDLPLAAPPSNFPVTARGGETAGNAPSVPSVALVVGDPQGSTSKVKIADAHGAVTTLGIVSHRQGSALRASTTFDQGVALDADISSGQDLSFVGGLFYARVGVAPKLLAVDVVHSSTPLALEDGRILVSRGAAGPPSDIADGRLASRIDDLTVDAVDPDRGTVETIAKFHGYLLFLAGHLGREVFLYRVGEGHADLLAVDVESLETRSLIDDMAPFARDFSVDAETKSVVFQDAEDDAWITERLSLSAMSISRIGRSTSMETTPHVLPGGDVLVTPESGRGPVRIAGGPVNMGPGVARLADVDPSRAFATGTAARPGELARPFIVNLSTGEVEWIAVDEGERAVVAGFMRGGR